MCLSCFIFFLNIPNKGYHLSSQTLCHLYTLAASHTALGNVGTVPRRKSCPGQCREGREKLAVSAWVIQWWDSPPPRAVTMEGRPQIPSPQQFLPQCLDAWAQGKLTAWGWCSYRLLLGRGCSSRMLCLWAALDPAASSCRHWMVSLHNPAQMVISPWPAPLYNFLFAGGT